MLCADLNERRLDYRALSLRDLEGIPPLLVEANLLSVGPRRAVGSFEFDDLTLGRLDAQFASEPVGT